MASGVEECGWVGVLLGGRVVRAERQGARRHGGRPAWFVDVEVEVAGGGGGAELRRCYVRMERPEHGDGRAALRREYRVLQALRAAGVRVPEMYALSEDPPAIVMEYLAGEGEYLLLTDPERRRGLDHQFLAELVKVHQADIGPFVALGLKVPSTPAEYVTLDLDTWQAAYHATVRRPVPLLEFTCRWLRRHIPPAPERPVLVQGDTGPGQFMFDGADMTGIVDWEFALLGDPMLDLALIRGRDFYNPGADLRDWFATYERLSGTPIDWPKLSYYTVKATAITPLSLAGLCQTMYPGADHAEWYAEAATFGRATAQALCEDIGVAPAAAVELPERRPGRLAPMYDVMEENLNGELRPADARGGHRMDLVLRLLTMVRNADALDGPLIELELDDLAGVLGGRRPGDLAAGDEALLALIADEDGDRDGDRDGDLAAYLWRRTIREEHLLRGALGAGESAVLVPLAALR